MPGEELGPLWFGLLGLLGALLRVWLWARGWQQLRAFESVRHLVVGFLSGIVYWFLHARLGFPDGVMAIVVGYFGSDLIHGIMKRLAGGVQGGAAAKG